MITKEIAANSESACKIFGRLLADGNALLAFTTFGGEIDFPSQHHVVIVSPTGDTLRSWDGPAIECPSWARVPGATDDDLLLRRAEVLVTHGQIDEASAQLELLEKTFAPRTTRWKHLSRRLRAAFEARRQEEVLRRTTERADADRARKRERELAKQNERRARERIESIVGQHRRRMDVSLRVCVRSDNCNYAVFGAFGFGCPGCRGSYEDALRRADEGATFENVVSLSLSLHPLELREILGVPLATAEELREQAKALHVGGFRSSDPLGTRGFGDLR